MTRNFNGPGGYGGLDLDLGRLVPGQNADRAGQALFKRGGKKKSKAGGVGGVASAAIASNTNAATASSQATQLALSLGYSASTAQHIGNLAAGGVAGMQAGVYKTPQEALADMAGNSPLGKYLAAKQAGLAPTTASDLDPAALKAKNSEDFKTLSQDQKQAVMDALNKGELEKTSGSAFKDLTPLQKEQAKAAAVQAVKEGKTTPEAHMAAAKVINPSAKPQAPAVNPSAAPAAVKTDTPAYKAANAELTKMKGQPLYKDIVATAMKHGLTPEEGQKLAMEHALIKDQADHFGKIVKNELKDSLQMGGYELAKTSSPAQAGAGSANYQKALAELKPNDKLAQVKVLANKNGLTPEEAGKLGEAAGLEPKMVNFLKSQGTAAPTAEAPTAAQAKGLSAAKAELQAAEKEAPIHNAQVINTALNHGLTPEEAHKLAKDMGKTDSQAEDVMNQVKAASQAAAPALAKTGMDAALSDLEIKKTGASVKNSDIINAAADHGLTPEEAHTLAQKMGKGEATSNWIKEQVQSNFEYEKIQGISAKTGLTSDHLDQALQNVKSGLGHTVPEDTLNALKDGGLITSALKDASQSQKAALAPKEVAKQAAENPLPAAQAKASKLPEGVTLNDKQQAALDKSLGKVTASHQEYEADNLVSKAQQFMKQESQAAGDSLDVQNAKVQHAIESVQEAQAKAGGVVGKTYEQKQAEAAKLQAEALAARQAMLEKGSFPLKGYRTDLNDISKGNAWGTKNFQGWSQSLNTGEHYILSNYQGTYYTQLNGLARGKYEGADKADIQKKMNDMDNAIAKGTVKEDIVGYRGLGGTTGAALVQAFKNGELEPGTVFSDLGYMSTSLTTYTAKKFAITNGQPYHSQVVISIEVPKGTNGAWMHSISSSYNEQEIVLPRGSRLEFKGARMGSNGMLIINASYVPHEIGQQMPVGEHKKGSIVPQAATGVEGFLTPTHADLTKNAAFKNAPEQPYAPSVGAKAGLVADKAMQAAALKVLDKGGSKEEALKAALAAKGKGLSEEDAAYMAAKSVVSAAYKGQKPTEAQIQKETAKLQNQAQAAVQSPAPAAPAKPAPAPAQSSQAENSGGTGPAPKVTASKSESAFKADVEKYTQGAKTIQGANGDTYLAGGYDAAKATVLKMKQAGEEPHQNYHVLNDVAMKYGLNPTQAAKLAQEVGAGTNTTKFVKQDVTAYQKSGFGYKPLTPAEQKKSAQAAAGVLPAGGGAGGKSKASGPDLGGGQKFDPTPMTPNQMTDKLLAMEPNHMQKASKASNDVMDQHKNSGFTQEQKNVVINNVWNAVAAGKSDKEAFNAGMKAAEIVKNGGKPVTGPDQASKPSQAAVKPAEPTGGKLSEYGTTYTTGAGKTYAAGGVEAAKKSIDGLTKAAKTSDYIVSVAKSHGLDPVQAKSLAAHAGLSEAKQQDVKDTVQNQINNGKYQHLGLADKLDMHKQLDAHKAANGGKTQAEITAQAISNQAATTGEHAKGGSQAAAVQSGGQGAKTQTEAQALKNGNAFEKAPSVAKEAAKQAEYLHNQHQASIQAAQKAGVTVGSTKNTGIGGQMLYNVGVKNGKVVTVPNEKDLYGAVPHSLGHEPSGYSMNQAKGIYQSLPKKTQEDLALMSNKHVQAALEANGLKPSASGYYANDKGAKFVGSNAALGAYLKGGGENEIKAAVTNAINDHFATMKEGAKAAKTAKADAYNALPLETKQNQALQKASVKDIANKAGIYKQGILGGKIPSGLNNDQVKIATKAIKDAIAAGKTEKEAHHAAVMALNPKIPATKPTGNALKSMKGKAAAGDPDAQQVLTAFGLKW